MLDHLDFHFRKRLVAKIEEQIEAEATVILGGAIKTFEDYKHRSGKVAALHEVLGIIKHVVDAMTGRDTEEM